MESTVIQLPFTSIIVIKTSSEYFGAASALTNKYNKTKIGISRYFIKLILS
jgi:hypothetical protein